MITKHNLIQIAYEDQGHFMGSTANKHPHSPNQNLKSMENRCDRSQRANSLLSSRFTNKNIALESNRKILATSKLFTRHPNNPRSPWFIAAVATRRVSHSDAVNVNKMLRCAKYVWCVMTVSFLWILLGCCSKTLRSFEFCVEKLDQFLRFKILKWFKTCLKYIRVKNYMLF